MIDVEVKKIEKIAYIKEEVIELFKETPIYISLRNRSFLAREILRNNFRRDDNYRLFLLEDKRIYDYLNLIS